MTFNLERNKNLLNVEDNAGLPYYSSSLGLVDESGKKKLIDKIDTFTEATTKRIKNKFDLSSKSLLNSLRKVKAELIQNTGDSVIFSRRVNEPQQQMKEKIKNVSKTLKKPVNLMNTFKQMTTTFNSTFLKSDAQTSNSSGFGFGNSLIKKKKELISDYVQEKKMIKGFVTR